MPNSPRTYAIKLEGWFGDGILKAPESRLRILASFLTLVFLVDTGGCNANASSSQRQVG